MDRGWAWLRWFVLAGLVLGGSDGRGQTLAHKNWEGSGLTVQAWWSRAVFCSAGRDLPRVMGEMEALERMGCDAVEVSPGEGFRAADEMDAVTEEAGRRKMRVVVDLDGAEEMVRGRMRFWGARGAAGFAVRGLRDEAVARLRQGAIGRVVIGDGGQLQVRTMPDGDAAGFRGWLSGTVRSGTLLEDRGVQLGEARAAMLLVSGVAARLAVDAVLPVKDAEENRSEFSAEELLLWVPKEEAAKDGMAEWVRQLSALHHQNAAFRDGQAIFLDFDALGVLGWMVPARDRRGTVLVFCNLSGKAVRVPVASVVKGRLVRTLLRSKSGGAGAVSPEGIDLGVGEVFIGETR